ncbi:MAG: stage 0 sporulation protein [Erysipelotrichaceae bacterium]|nr:stage 0 sporulation protein [Erysipelotrichaceae bacterium]
MEETNVQYVAVRFPRMNKSYTFSVSGLTLKVKDKVVVETKRGLELGEVVSGPNPESGLSADQEVKPVIRLATKEDEEASRRNLAEARDARREAQEEADKLGLNMNFISADYTLDHAKITLIYLADSRVDFRELLKVLAAHFRCRIDLRQVGARDKAKMVGGIGVCGRELCCSKFINEFERVSINMAKNQLLALNIAKLSGHCGSLLCCLRFEDEAYKELRKGLPKLNSRVEYNGEMYHLTSMNVLEGNCKLENRDSALFITLEELQKNGKFKRAGEQPKEEKKAEA